MPVGQKRRNTLRLKNLLFATAALSALWLTSMGPLPAFADDGGKGGGDAGLVGGIIDAGNAAFEPLAAQPNAEPLDATTGGSSYDTRAYAANSIDRLLGDIRSQMLSVGRQCW